MYIPFEENIALFAIVGCSFAFLFALLYRGVWRGFYDPIFIGTIFIGLNTCFVTSVMFVPILRPVVIFCGVLSFMLSFRIGVGDLGAVINQTSFYRPYRDYEAPIGIVLIVSATVVFSDLIVNVIPTIGMVDDLGSNRYLLGANNRFLSTAGYSARIMPLVLLLLTNRKWQRNLCILLILYEPIFGLLNGSKSVLFGLALKVGFLLFLRRTLLKDDGIRGLHFLKRVPFRRSYAATLIVVFAIITTLLTPLYIGRELSVAGYESGLTVIGQRVLLGFDSAFMAIQIDMQFPSKGLNLLELWFASPLKVMGLFHGEWNAINEFVGMNFMSMSDGQRMQFPNNFLVLEVYGSLGWLVGIPLLCGLGYFSGAAVRWSAARRSRLYWAFWFAVLCVNPFQLLVDGQSFFNSIFITGLFSLPLYFTGLFVSDQVLRKNGMN